MVSEKIKKLFEAAYFAEGRKHGYSEQEIEVHWARQRVLLEDKSLTDETLFEIVNKAEEQLFEGKNNNANSE